MYPCAETRPFRTLPAGSWGSDAPTALPWMHMLSGHPSGHPTQSRLSRCSHLARVGLPAPIDLAEAPSTNDAVHAEVVHG